LTLIKRESYFAALGAINKGVPLAEAQLKWETGTHTNTSLIQLVEPYDVDRRVVRALIRTNKKERKKERKKGLTI
jgi:hypothetical protein